MFYCDAKHSDTLLVPVMFVITYFWVAVFKNGHGLLDNGNLKSTVSQESELIKGTDFFAC